MSGVTAALIRSVRAIASDAIPDDALAAARHCILDWFGCTLAGSRERLTSIILEAADAPGDARVIGHDRTLAPSWAALVNGAASHALDYDDTHIAMGGHPTAPVLPALLALAERTGACGRDVLTAFVAGVETECRLGAVLGPGHYAAGWHATATFGSFGAAAACAHLLGLDPGAWAHAFGLAATQAGGLKSVFGTMSKPFHAGRAAMNGYVAAQLASRGFTSDTDVLAAFAATHAGRIDTEAVDRLDGGFCVRDTLFKYHAACYLTQSSIEAALQIGVPAPDVDRVDVLVPPGHLDVCNIAEPRTGLEGKFSLRMTVAMALRGDPTDEAAFTDARMADPTIVALRDRVTVRPVDGLRPAESTVIVHTRDGNERTATVDAGRPADDLGVQWQRLSSKFTSLATPVIGADAAARVHELVSRIEDADGVGKLLELTRP
jgi:2-methylcitrate dehydratase PrpD